MRMPLAPATKINSDEGNLNAGLPWIVVNAQQSLITRCLSLKRRKIPCSNE